MVRTRRRRSRLSFATALAVALFVTVACSSGSAPEASPKTLRVLMTDDWVTTPFLDAVRDFERSHPNVRVAVDKQPIRGILDGVERTVKDGGTPPDVVQGHAFAAAARDVAEPLDDLWAKYLDAADFFPGALEDVTYGGHRYGVPLDTNALVMVLNSNEFRAHNLAVPSGPVTFGDLKGIAGALTPAEGPERAMAFPTSTWWTFGWVAANGGEWVRLRPDGKPEFTLDSQANVETLGFLADLVGSGLAYGPRAAETHSSDVFALFESGTTSMHATGTWDVARLRRSRPDVEYRAAPMPRGMTGATQGSAMGGSSLFVPKGSKQRELAFEFMRHVISDRYALRLAKEEGRLPVRARVWSSDTFFQDQVLQVVLDQLRTARPERIDGFAVAGTALRIAIDKILRQEADPASALHEAQVVAQASLGPS